MVNRQDIHYDFWPLPYVIEAPAFLFAVATFLLGLQMDPQILGNGVRGAQSRDQRLAAGINPASGLRSFR